MGRSAFFLTILLALLFPKVSRNQELPAYEQIREICLSLVERYPPSHFYLVFPGGSGTPFTAFLQEYQANYAHNVPLTTKPTFDDPKQPRPGTAEWERLKPGIYKTFDHYLTPEIVQNRTMVVLDFAYMGTSFPLIVDLFTDYNSWKHAPDPKFVAFEPFERRSGESGGFRPLPRGVQSIELPETLETAMRDSVYKTYREYPKANPTELAEKIPESLPLYRALSRTMAARMATDPVVQQARQETFSVVRPLPEDFLKPFPGEQLPEALRAVATASLPDMVRIPNSLASYLAYPARGEAAEIERLQILRKSNDIHPQAAINQIEGLLNSSSSKVRGLAAVAMHEHIAIHPEAVEKASTLLLSSDPAKRAVGEILVRKNLSIALQQSNSALFQAAGRPGSAETLLRIYESAPELPKNRVYDLPGLYLALPEQKRQRVSALVRESPYRGLAAVSAVGLAGGPTDPKGELWQFAETVGALELSPEAQIEVSEMLKSAKRATRPNASRIKNLRRILNRQRNPRESCFVRTFRSLLL